MRYLILAKAVAAIHLLFSAFAVTGAFVVPFFPYLLWPHLVAVAWSVGTLAFDWGCPLTPWEKRLTERAGRDAYAEGFLQHYIFRTQRSPADSRRMHIYMAIALLLFNAAIYTIRILRAGPQG